MLAAPTKTDMIKNILQGIMVAVIKLRLPVSE